MKAEGYHEKYIFLQFGVGVCDNIIDIGRSEGVKEDEGKDPPKAIDVEERMPIILFSGELLP